MHNVRQAAFSAAGLWRRSTFGSQMFFATDTENHNARVWSRAHRPSTLWPWLILPAGLIPLAGLLDVDWSKTTAIAGSVFDYATTGVVEELVFRELVLTGLAIGLNGKHNATLKAVVASSILFGLPHLPPSALCLPPCLACRLLPSRLVPTRYGTPLPCTLPLTYSPISPTLPPEFTAVGTSSFRCYSF